MSGGNGEGAVGRPWWKSGMAGVWLIAAGTVVVHLATGWRYGFDRDELMALEDARHLAWGYVQYPPMTAFFGWVALKLFGTSLLGFRLFAALAQAGALVLTGKMAKAIAVASGEWRVARKGGPTFSASREARMAQKHSPFEKSVERKTFETTAQGKQEWLCHGEWAAVVAAGAGVPFCLGGGALMQYISFDYLCWVLVSYGMIRVLSGEIRRQESKEARSEKWWLVVGLGIGLGMLAKYTMALLAAGVVAGVLLTDARKWLRSGWLWVGVAAATLVVLPNFLWQWRRDFVSMEFLRFIHERDVRLGLTDWFLAQQLELTLLALPLALAGLWFYFAAEEGKPWRAMGWMYAVPLALLVAMRGRDYYLAPAYPMLYAAGAAWMEKQWRVAGGEWRDKAGERVRGDTGARVGWWPRIKKGIAWALVADAVAAACVALPVMPVNSQWWKWASRVNIVLPEEIGWPELASTVAKIRDEVPEGERARLGILARNYGEVGALNLYGEKYGLPRAISGANSSWERGYGNPAPETVIAVGFSRKFLEEDFASCELAGHTWNRYGVANEETTENPDIFVCRRLRGSWEEFWKKVRVFA